MCSRWHREGQARASPQSPEKQGWSPQTCSVAPGTPCSLSPACLAAPAAADCSKRPTSICTLISPPSDSSALRWGLVPLPSSLFLQVMLPFPSFVPLQAPSPSFLLWNSRKSHFNLSGLTSSPDFLAQGRKRHGEASSSSGPASPASPHAQDVLPHEQEPQFCLWGCTS